MKFKDFIVKKTLVEMDERYIDIVTKWLKEHSDQLPFNHLFKNNEFRKIIPFQSKKKLSFRKQLEDMGYKVDFERGIVSKQIKTQKGTVDREQKIGKVLANPKNGFGKSTLDWWSTFAGQDDKEDEWGIIVSRHPIDVLRMSDHSGLESCHSQGGSYFQCAISEAKGGGGIAYLVDSSQLKQISKEDLQEEELFDDYARMSGPERANKLVPDARIRLRLFTHNRDEYDLAVPETRLYGQSVEGFKESVYSWALSAQQNVLQGERPDVDDFTRYGGSYQDTSDGKLFNNLFQDNSDDNNASAEYGGEDDSEGQAEQYQEEAQEFHDRYADFEHNEISAGFDVYDDGDGPHVSFSGEVIVKFKSSDWLKKVESTFSVSTYRSDSEAKEDDWKMMLNEIYENSDIPGNSDRYLSIDASENPIKLAFEIRADEEGHPDDYHTFLTGPMKDLDNDYGEFYTIVKEVLQKHGWLKRLEQDDWLEDQEARFKNLSVDYHLEFHQPAIEIELPLHRVGDLRGIDPMDDSSAHPEEGGFVHTPIDVRAYGNGELNSINSNSPGFKEFYTVFVQKITQQFKAINKQDKRQLPIPGFAPKDIRRKIQTNIPSTYFYPEIRWAIDYDRNVYLKLEWNIPMYHMDSKANLDLLKWIDDNFDWTNRLIANIFEMTVKRKYRSHGKALALKDKQETEFADQMEKGQVQFRLGKPRPA